MKSKIKMKRENKIKSTVNDLDRKELEKKEGWWDPTWDPTWRWQSWPSSTEKQKE